MGVRARMVIGSVGLASTMLACSALLESNVQQCTVDGDCDRRGFSQTRCAANVCVPSTGPLDAATPDVQTADTTPIDPRWACLGKVVWGNEKVTEKVMYKQLFVRLLGRTPVSSLYVEACGSVDPDCAAPVANTTTAADGFASLLLPTNFRGYLHIDTPPPGFPTMVPSIVAVTPPPDEDTNRVFDPALAPSLVSTGELNALLAQVGASADPLLGHVFGLVVDCNGAPAEGVEMRAATRDKKTIAFYYAGQGTPTITGTQTDATGLGGFINLPSGVVDVTLTLISTRQRVGSYPTFVKKGAATTIDFWPTP